MNIWGHETQSIDQLHFINKLSIYFLSPIANLVLFYMIVFKSPALFRGYQMVLLFGSIVDCSVMMSLWMMRFFRFENGYFVYFFNWPEITVPVQWVFFACYWSCSTLQSAAVVLEFWFRYVLIKQRKPPTSILLICMSLLVVGFSFTASLFVVFHYVASVVESTGHAFLIFDTKANQWGFLSLQYRRQVIFASYLLPIIFAALSIRALKRQTFTMSHKAKRLLDDFSMTLYIKNIAPTFMIFLPLLVRYATDFYKVQSWIIDEFVVTMYSWLPFINAVLTLFLISHYRKALFRGIKRLSFTSSNSVHTSIIP